MRTLRVAIIGCGRMGNLRAQAAQRFGASVLAVFDPDAARAEQLAQSMPGCCAQPLADHTDWSDFDAVFVCTPPAARGNAQAALAQGLPTFIEKPVAVRAADAQALLRNARGVITAVGYMNRYRESIVRLRERLPYETVLGASAHWVNGVYAVPWWTRSEASGGSLNEQATHVIDLFRHLLGEPEAVHAFATPHREHSGIVGNAVVSLSFANGVLATLFYSCQAQAKAMGLRLFTSVGETALQDWDFHEGPAVAASAADRNRIFVTETHAFLTAVTRGDAGGIRCDVADAMRTQHVLDAVGRSWTEGRACRVEADEPLA